MQANVINGFLFYNKKYSRDFIRKTIESNNLRGLKIFAILEEDRVKDLSFLRDYTFLKELDITSRDDHNFDFLNDMIQLESLNINAPGENLIDLSELLNLETFY